MKRIALISIAILAASCQRSDDGSTNLLADDLNMEVAVDHKDLALFQTDGFTSVLDCEGVSSEVPGQVMISSDYKTMTLAFNPGQNLVIGKMCQIRVNGIPKDASSIVSITDNESSDLLYISKPALVAPGEINSEGQKVGEMTIILVKAFRSLVKAKEQRPDPAPIIVLEPNDAAAPAESQETDASENGG